MTWEYEIAQPKGEGTGARLAGFLRVVGDQLTIDDVALMEALKEFDGRMCELMLYMPAHPAAYPIDGLIKPLVLALQACGIRTISSCQGHMDATRFPYVTCTGGVARDITVAPKGWIREDRGYGLWRIRPEQEAETEEELKAMQDEALRFAVWLKEILTHAS